jgi:hypothetical protein
MMTGMAVTQYQARRVLVHAHRAASVGTGIAFVARAVLPHQPWGWLTAGAVAEVVNVAWNAWLVRWAEAARQVPRTAVFPDGAEPGVCPVCGMEDPDGITDGGWHETCMEWLGDGTPALRLQRAARERRDREYERRRDDYIHQKAREQEREERRQLGGWTAVEVVARLRAGLLSVNDVRATVAQSGCEHERTYEVMVWGGATFRRCEECGATLSVTNTTYPPQVQCTNALAHDAHPWNQRPGAMWDAYCPGVPGPVRKKRRAERRYPTRGGYESGPLSIDDLPPIPEWMIAKPKPAAGPDETFPRRNY